MPGGLNLASTYLPAHLSMAGFKRMVLKVYSSEPSSFLYLLSLAYLNPSVV